jgi:hypothetical protein
MPELAESDSEDVETMAIVNQYVSSPSKELWQLYKGSAVALAGMEAHGVAGHRSC